MFAYILIVLVSPPPWWPLPQHVPGADTTTVATQGDCPVESGGEWASLTGSVFFPLSSACVLLGEGSVRASLDSQVAAVIVDYAF